MRLCCLLPALVLIATAACAAERPRPALDRVRLGMTPREVEATAGKPADTILAPCGPGSPTVFVYAGEFPDRLESSVTFIDDVVVEVVEHRRTLISEPAERLVQCGGPWPSAPG